MTLAAAGRLNGRSSCLGRSSIYKWLMVGSHEFNHT